MPYTLKVFVGSSNHQEDDLFMVTQGHLQMQFLDRTEQSRRQIYHRPARRPNIVPWPTKSPSRLNNRAEIHSEHNRERQHQRKDGRPPRTPFNFGRWQRQNPSHRNNSLLYRHVFTIQRALRMQSASLSSPDGDGIVANEIKPSPLK